MNSAPVYVLADELREKGVVYHRGDSLVIEEPYRTMLIEQHAAREPDPGEVLSAPPNLEIDELLKKHGMLSRAK